MVPIQRYFERALARRAAAWAVLVFLTGIIGVAQGTGQSSGNIVITNVAIAREGELTVVTIEANGPLPVPVVGELDAPPRVFMDFAGVGASTRGTAGQPGDVVRVRVALHSSTPRITRAVIDLKEKKPIRTEDGALQAGRFKVLVGPVAPPDAAPTPPPEHKQIVRPEPPATSLPPVPPIPVPAGSAPATPPPKPATKQEPAGTSSPPSLAPPPAVYPSRPPDPTPPDRDRERYREQVQPTIERLRKMRPLLTAIDQREAKPPENLAAAREELSGILRALTSVRTPDSLKGTHDLLLRSASLALMAATLRADAGTRAEPEMMKNAASAAAGSLLLFDRVCVAIDVPCGA